MNKYLFASLRGSDFVSYGDNPMEAFKSLLENEKKWFSMETRR
jgi:hypothetical protein